MAKLRDGPGKVSSVSPSHELTSQTAVQQRALRTLKQKRMYETQLNTLQQQTFNMEQAAMTTENLKNTMTTVDAMRVANKEMKKQYKGIDIDKIESIHYDMEDLIEQANEIQESLGRSYGVPEEIDEDDLQAELDALGLDDDIGETEAPSYLQDSTALPDFVDAAPVEEEAPKQPAAEIAR